MDVGACRYWSEPDPRPLPFPGYLRYSLSAHTSPFQDPRQRAPTAQGVRYATSPRPIAGRQERPSKQGSAVGAMVKTLLSWSGKKGRGKNVVETIHEALKETGLFTHPEFTF